MGYLSGRLNGKAWRKKLIQILPPAPPSGDPFYEYVSLLLHMEGSNGGTTFVDNSQYTHAITPNGGANTSISWNKAGSTSLAVATAGDRLQIPDNASLQLGSGEFTIEMSFRLTAYAPSVGGNYIGMLMGKDMPSNREFLLYVQGTATSYDSLRLLTFTNLSGASLIVPQITYSFLLNTDYDIRVTRKANLIYFHVNGTLINPSGSTAGNMGAGTAQIHIGDSTYPGTQGPFIGYIDEVRITKGIARSLISYVPTWPFPDSL